MYVIRLLVNFVNCDVEQITQSINQ